MRLRSIAVLVVLSALAGTAGSTPASGPDGASPRPKVIPITRRVQDRLTLAKQAWERREWPTSNPGARPSFEQSMPPKRIADMVDEDRRRTGALLELGGALPDAGEVQGELNRIASHTRAPEALRRAWEALGNDPERIAAAMVIPKLVDRRLRQRFETDRGRADALVRMDEGRSFDEWWLKARATFAGRDMSLPTRLVLPEINAAPCGDGQWLVPAPVVPGSRSRHTVAWTGNEMIVWGGLTASGVRLATGLRYDPTTDTWSETSIQAATPEARSGHTAVWTGQEMVVWGGWTGVMLNSGGRYDPATDSWQSTSPTGAPPGGADHTAVWTGNEMIVAGVNRLSGGIIEKVFGRYRPSTDSWAPAGSTPILSSQRGHAAVWTGTAMVVLGGELWQDGCPGQYNQLSGVVSYTPATDTWTILPTMFRRAGHIAVWTGSEIIVYGGRASNCQQPSQGTIKLASGQRLSLGGGAWTTIPADALDVATDNVPGLWTGTEMIFGTIRRYNPATGVWSAIPSYSGDSEAGPAQAVWTGSDLLFWNGETGGRYSPAANQWFPVSSRRAPTTIAAANNEVVWTGNEMILFGDPPSRYDPLTDEWNQIPGLFHFLATAVWTGQEVLLFGNPNGTSVTRYDPGTNIVTTSNPSGAPDARTGHAAVWSGTEMIIWGGDLGSGSGTTSTGGRFNPVTTSWMPTKFDATTPLWRTRPIAFWTGSEMLVWGGFNGTALTDGGRYDPATDSWTPVPDGPVSASDGVWTGSEMIVWSGNAPACSQGATGARYRPSDDSWTPTAVDAMVPSARDGFVLVWDGTGMLVWGGLETCSNSPINTGARYDPVDDTWTPIAITSETPAPRQYPVGVWAGDRMIVWGGSDRFGNRFDDGGMYCACAGGGLWYQDSDGDGLGDSSEVVASCTQPAGHVPDGSDCNDANPEVWGRPAEAVSLDFTDPETLAWSPPAEPGAQQITYDLLRSSDPASFAAPGACLDSGLAAPTCTDATAPALNGILYYLVRAVNQCPGGAGTLGAGSNGVERAGPAACP